MSCIHINTDSSSSEDIQRSLGTPSSSCEQVSRQLGNLLNEFMSSVMPLKRICNLDLQFCLSGDDSGSKHGLSGLRGSKARPADHV